MFAPVRRWLALSIFCLIGVVALTTLIERPGLAQTDEGPASPGYGLTFTSHLRIHNPDPAHAVICNLNLLDSSGTHAGQTQSVQLRPYVTGIVDFTDFSNVDAGAYSGYLDCSHAVSTVLIYGEPGDRIYTAYSGAESVRISNHWQILETFTGTGNTGFASSVIVQNATADPTDVSVRFLSRRDGSLIHFVDLLAVPAWSAHEVHLADMNAFDEHESVRTEVKSSNHTAVLVFHHDHPATDDNDTVFRFPRTAFVPSPSMTTRLSYPAMLVNYQEMNTSLEVLGLGTEPVQLSVNYPGFGTQRWELTPGRVTTIKKPSFMPNGSYVASVSISASHPISVQAHTRHDNGSIAVLAATEYASTKVSAPLILRRRDGFSSIVSCQNLGDVATEIFFEHVGRFARIKYVQPGHSVTRQMTQENLLPNNYDGTMVIRASEPIKCVVIQLRDRVEDNPPSTTQLSADAELRSILLYEGFGSR